MKTTPDNQSLLDLVKSARTGKIVLPQFQRNFVWSRDDITGLLISILEGHFIGSFLLLRTDAESVPFAIRAIEGVNLQPHQLRPDWMILDGQQRMTSLHYVFAAPKIALRWTKYPYRFFLNLRQLAEQDFENAVWSERSDSVAAYLDRQTQFERLILPFTQIEQWDAWRDAYEDWLWSQGDGAFAAYRERYRSRWNEAMARIHSFMVPTIEIPKIPPDNPKRIAEVCAIFEKMNSTGVRLSVYDLLTARLYKFGIDLHALWEEAVQTHDLLNQVSEGKPDSYGIYLLRTVALLRGLDVKSQTLINLKPDGFEADWRRAAAYSEAALQRITSTNDDGFGAFDAKWMPYSTMISPMAALLAQIDEAKSGHHAYKLLRKWYWAAVFRERYAGAVESTIYRDYQDLLAACRGENKTPQLFADADDAILNNERYSLLDVNRVNSVYRGVMCLIALAGAKDFQADDSIEFHALDDHHIFPRAWLAAKKVDARLINCVVNRTLISSYTNRRISHSSPSRYVEAVIPRARAREILTSHLIDEEAQAAMQTDDFDAFLLHRERSLLAAIRRRLTL